MRKKRETIKYHPIGFYIRNVIVNSTVWLTSYLFVYNIVDDLYWTFLQVLDLGGNNLQILPREVFSRHGLLNLQKLKLSNCKIGQIDPTAFRGRLLFRMNFIFEMIKCLICSGLTNLVELDLSSNKLASVPTPTFSGKYNQEARVSLCCIFAKTSFWQSWLYMTIFLKFWATNSKCRNLILVLEDVTRETNWF